MNYRRSPLPHQPTTPPLTLPGGSGRTALFLKDQAGLARKLKDRESLGTFDTDNKYDTKWIPLAKRILQTPVLDLAPPPSPEAIRAWGARFPHCQGIVEWLADLVALSVWSDTPCVQSPPLLLVGPPGIGKTTLLLDLAIFLGVPSRIVSLGSTSDGFILTGSSLEYGTGKIGAILETLLQGTANPIIVLDEIDKAGQGASNRERHVSESLLDLLEPRTSVSFLDEALDWPVDASRIFWVATANDKSRIPAPVLSRFHTLEVREPTPAEMREVILPDLYREILREYGVENRAPRTLPPAVLEAMGQNPRSARRQIVRLIAKAAATGSQILDPAWIEKESQGSECKRIGFQQGGPL